MNLVLDIGNSRVKAGFFKEQELLFWEGTTAFDSTWLDKHFQQFPATRALISATGELPEGLISWLDTYLLWSQLDHTTALPFHNAYKSPQTLGRDRIAGICGALALHIEPPFLVLDAGTCLTMDILDKEGTYWGGSISPGIGMRAKAMHLLTHKLPLIDWHPDQNLPGTTTESSLNAGAFMGTVCEIEGMVDRYHKKYPHLNIVITGGDANNLANATKYPIFAVPELVLRGLNHILNYNAETV